jgi:hypothetical protein
MLKVWNQGRHMITALEIDRIVDELNSAEFKQSGKPDLEGESEGFNMDSMDKVSILMSLVKVVRLFNQFCGSSNFSMGFDAVSYNNECLVNIEKISKEIGIGFFI